MFKRTASLFSVLAMLLIMSSFALGQETTGDMEITVKDPNGAVVPNVALTVTSGANTAGFKRTVTTDDNGFVRIIQVPPGTYTIAAAATAGFQAKTVTDVQIALGQTTPVIVEVSTSVGGTVTITETDTPPIDPTDNKIQTTISAQTAELLPKGTNFSSILKVSPATRPEPRSGQFQIDGASGSENTFIVDGQEVTNVRTGTLDANSNLPFQLIQEVQIKSSGFEAQYGGATGGVINVVTKGGSNEWRGEFGAIFRPSKLNAIGRPTLRTSPSTGGAEYFPNQRDTYLEFNPSANLGGPIIKDRLWFFGSYSPQIFTRNRTLTYLNDNTRIPTGRVEAYRFKEVDEYTFLRLDGQPFSRLRLNAAYTWNPIVQEGAVPTYVSRLAAVPILAGTTIDGAAYLNNTGGRQNSQSITGQAVWTVTNNLFISARAGHYFLNEKLNSYGQGDPAFPRVTCSNTGIGQFPAGFGCIRNQNNGVPVINLKRFDATTRNTWDADATFITNFGGRHEFKGGYQFNGVANKVDGQQTDQIVLRIGWTVGNQNPQANYSGRAILSSPTAIGAGFLRFVRTQGDVSSKNEGIFIQDKWQPVNRLTFNLGIRTEREDVPSFTPGAPGVKFDFQDKLAPRLGVAYDLTGDGKTKISAFYGLFYDRFKYELPRGSFGGEVFHDLYYEIFPTDNLAFFTVQNITGGIVRPGGACPGGTIVPVYGRVRCDIDNRIASNTGLPLTQGGGIDPDIKAFQQREMTVTFERDLGHNMVFSGRYTRKEVLHTVEDAGFPNAEGSEFYIIGNPGEGLYKQTAEGFGLQALKPKRQYDALELRLDRRFANNYYFNLNYTWSRLVGNYSGLSSSDEDGRLSPNVNRYFDQPQAGYTLAGGPDNGVLSTDRPHVLKFYGAYNLNWNDRFGFGGNNETSFQLFTTVQSGTPITSTVDLNGIDTVVLSRRGDKGRTELFTETDFGVRHRYRFGRDNRFTLVGEFDILNLFNEANETNRDNLINLSNFPVDDPANGLITQAQRDACDVVTPQFPNGNNQPCLIAAYRNFQLNGAPLIAAQANGAAGHNPTFNFANAFQGPRIVRFGFRLLF